MEAQASDLDLCVVIVNYGTPEMVIDCLESLLDELRTLRGVVSLVDNASPDDSVPRLRSWIRDNNASELVKLIESSENGGFSAGNEIGIRSFEAKFYLLLNSDTLVRDGAMTRMLETIRSEPEVGIVSPRLEWEDGEPQVSCFRFHRPLSELIKGAATGPITKVLKRYDVSIPVSEVRSFPDWTSFACAMIRREVFDQIGMLDRGYFMYFDDPDFCWRAKQAGWRVLNDPTARIVHLRGGSGPVKSSAHQRKRLPRYFYESRTRFFFKAYGRSGLLAANCCWTLGWLISSTRALVQPAYHPPTCESQWRDTWINFSAPMAPYTHPQTGRT